MKNLLEITNTARLVWKQGDCLKPLAVLQNENDAHMVAEVLSYKENGNAIYGLFKYRIGTWEQFTADRNAQMA